jgi:NTE family protein
MGPMTTSKRIAIACQGGGSQCAFVAGALKTLLVRGAHQRFRIVGLSGTSGGALTAALAWIDVLKQAKGDRTPVGDRIIAFWKDLTAQTPREIAIDKMCVQMQRLVERGILPSFASSPSSPAFQRSTRALAKLIGRPEFTDLRALLVKHIEFDALSSLVGPGGPVLLVGAADVLEGSFKVFSSVRGEITVESLLASAAIPNLFPAVQIDGHAYWDGIFSTNPPAFAFLQEKYMGKDMRPEEIWVIQVNRAQHDFVPEMPSDIFDRRNHLAGNLSLQHELQLIDMVNLLLQEGALTDRFRTRFGIETTTSPIAVRFIRMSRELQQGLDYPSKLSRQPAHIARLIADGEAQADAFLNGLDDGARLLEPDLTESLDGDTRAHRLAGTR